MGVLRSRHSSLGCRGSSTRRPSSESRWVEVTEGQHKRNTPGIAIKRTTKKEPLIHMLLKGEQHLESSGCPTDPGFGHNLLDKEGRSVSSGKRPEPKNERF